MRSKTCHMRMGISSTPLFIFIVVCLFLPSQITSLDRFVSVAHYEDDTCEGPIMSYTSTETACIPSEFENHSIQTYCDPFVHQQFVKTWNNSNCEGEPISQHMLSIDRECTKDFNSKQLCGDPYIAYQGVVTTYSTDACLPGTSISHTVYRLGECYKSHLGIWTKVECGIDGSVAVRTFSDDECHDEQGLPLITTEDCNSGVRVTFCSHAADSKQAAWKKAAILIFCISILQFVSL